jgi:thiamine biosynthesis lipoprotein
MRWFLLLLLIGCTSQEHHFEGIAMKIPYHVIVGKSLSSKEEEQVTNIIKETFNEINQTFNHYNPSSELSLLNNSTQMNLSSPLLDLINLSRNINLLTQGRFDPTLGAVILKWKRSIKQGYAPENLSSSPTGFENLEIQGSHCHKKRPVILDFDGIAKGYAVDLITERLSSYHNVFVDWGGDIRVLGHHPSRRPWAVKIAISNEIISLENEAIATSGETFQIHIINPLTLKPLTKSPFTSISVLAPTCALADSLATAAMIFETPEELEELKKQTPNAKFLVLYK